MILRNFAVLGAAVALTACASSAFQASWRAPDAEPLQVQGSMVAAVVMMEETAARRDAEDTLARELTLRGAVGVPMYQIFPDTDPTDEAAARAALEREGYAGLVVLRPIDTTQEIVSTPMYTVPYYSMYWGGYYGYGWGMPWGMGFGVADVHTHTIVSVETLVYSLRQNKLVWGGQSETTNPSSVGRLVTDTARKVARELERQGLIPKTP